MQKLQYLSYATLWTIGWTITVYTGQHIVNVNCFSIVKSIICRLLSNILAMKLLAPQTELKNCHMSLVYTLKKKLKK